MVFQGEDSEAILVVLCEMTCCPECEHGVEGLVLDASQQLGPARRKRRTPEVKQEGGRD